jgi:hypothetical protein
LNKDLIIVLTELPFTVTSLTFFTLTGIRLSFLSVTNTQPFLVGTASFPTIEISLLAIVKSSSFESVLSDKLS